MPTSSDKQPIYLLDSMSFIFRAYHAMQRQRPMSTRNGVPTAATFVFVNMINKLRRDFSPVFFAASSIPARRFFAMNAQSRLPLCANGVRRRRALKR